MNRWFLHTVSVSLIPRAVVLDRHGRFRARAMLSHEVLQEIGNLAARRRLAGKGVGSRVGLHPPRVVGFGIACALGIRWVFMGINKYFNAFLQSIFNLISPCRPFRGYPFPSWLGIGEEPKIFIIAIVARSCPSCSTPTTASGSSTRRCMMWSAWRAEAA